jgi:hypothetical protein
VELYKDRLPIKQLLQPVLYPLQPKKHRLVQFSAALIIQQQQQQQKQQQSQLLLLLHVNILFVFRDSLDSNVLFIAEPCNNTRPHAITVTDRNSTMFTGFITYDCSFINWVNVTVLYNSTLANCFASVHVSNITQKNDTTTVTCNNIQNNAGRNWTFNVLHTSILPGTFINETFTITLEPLPLNNESVKRTINEDLTSASFWVPDCEKIADPTYLVFRCNSSNESNDTFLENNCTSMCPVQPGGSYHSVLVQLPIKIADKINDTNNTFPQETLDEIYEIGEKHVFE